MTEHEIHQALSLLASKRFDAEGNLKHIDLDGYKVCVNRGFQITTPNGAVRHFKQYEALKFLANKLVAND